MFPVHTGINRGGAAEGFLKNDVPCTHRDKPSGFTELKPFEFMFPVHTGINRFGYYRRGSISCVSCIHRDKI